MPGMTTAAIVLVLAGTGLLLLSNQDKRLGFMGVLCLASSAALSILGIFVGF